MLRYFGNSLTSNFLSLFKLPETIVNVVLQLKHFPKLLLLLRFSARVMLNVTGQSHFTHFKTQHDNRVEQFWRSEHYKTDAA